MQEQGTKMFVDAVLKTHERVVQVRMFELPSASPEGGSDRPPARLTPFLCPLLVQLSSLEAAACPVLLDVLLQNQPEGVELSVSEVSRSTSWRGVAE